MAEDERTQKILAAARKAGTTGCTVLNQARGEGVQPTKTFLGLSIDSQVDVILMLAEEHMSREIMEQVARLPGSLMKPPGPVLPSRLTLRTPLASATRLRR
jgi:aspartate-semialdehyde dehydrogenase